MSFKLPECEKCLYTYLRGCPCGNSLHNAACLTLYKDIDEWTKKFLNINKALEKYDNTRPLMDELKFVKDLSVKNKITEKEVLWVIREIRRYKNK